MDNLLSFETLVQDKSKNQKLDAINQGLQVICHRVTGDPLIHKNEELKEIFGETSEYVSQYSYSTNANQDLILKVTYNLAKIEPKLFQFNYGVWGKSRPETLVWILFDKNINAIDRPQMKEQIVQHLLELSDEKGLPLIFPTSDLEDLEAINLNDALQDNSFIAQDTQKKYQADQIIIPIVSKHGLWKIDWRLHATNGIEKWVTLNKKMNLCIEDGLNELFKTMASRYASKQNFMNTDTKYRIIFGNIRTAKDHANVRRLLFQLDAVKNVKLSDSENNSICFNVDINGGIDPIIQTICSDRRFRHIESFFEQEQNIQTIQFECID